MSIYGDNILNEYSGNAADNQNFAKCMEELGKIGSYYVELDKTIADHIDLVVAGLSKCKSKSDLSKLLNKSYNDADASNKKLNETFKKFNERPTFTRFRSLVKKFSVKYSDVTMEEKKKWAKVFIGYHEDMIGIVQKYDKAWVDKLLDAIDKCKKYDYETADKLLKHIGTWYNGLYDYFRYTHGNILYVIYKLDTGFEDSFKYKMIQKIFKSK